jgi:hypothetical protein
LSRKNSRGYDHGILIFFFFLYSN